MSNTPDNRSVPRAAGRNSVTASPAVPSRRRFLSLLCFVLLFSVSLSLLFCSEANAKTTYPVIIENESTTELSRNYTFTTYDYSDTLHYGCIYRNGKEMARLKLDGYNLEMKCVGKYGKKYYFNVSNFMQATGVYSYKPGDKKFKLVRKGLNFNYFKKSYTTYRKQYSGLMAGRYILARSGYPTDFYDGYGTAYVYDLKKNKARKLGDARDIIRVGKKIYWTTTTPHDWANADNPKIIVKRASLSGKGKKTIKTFRPACMKQSNYGGGTIGKRTVTWEFLVDDNAGFRSETVKRKYR